MIRVVVEELTDVGKNVAGSITLDVQFRHGVAHCLATIDAPDGGHKPRLSEVEIPGVPDGADAVWLLGEVIRRAYAFAEEAPEREY
ncbi:hypothetical protein WMF38_57780 [Sorangium sp. So ce118]